MPRLLILVWLSLCLSACTSFEDVDLRPLLEQQHFPVAQGAVPADAETVGMIAVEDTGFYLFGVLSISPVSYETCVKVMVERAQRLGAEGIAEVRMSYAPSVFLRIVFIFPDWFATVQMTGSAWRRKSARGG